jgi:putative spermidine/putrescine transport system ATP-binding protein
VARLELRNLSKRFREVTALAGLTLDIGSGEFVSLLGPSGCGKTTALRIVAGFEQPTAGQVLLAGRDLTGMPANKRNMGMVFQAYSLFPNMTARHNVEFGLRVRGVERGQRHRRGNELLELVGLAAHAEHYPHQLSGGQQQRVALARALAIEPAVLLLDEPLSALDAKVRLQLREEIRRIQRRLGITTLYVTHDQEEALSISDRVAVMSEGRLEQVGTPAEIYQAPRTPFVAEFVGTMNRLAGTIESEGTVTVGGHQGRKVRLPLRSRNGLPVGAPVLVLIRPESVGVESAAGGQAPPGAFGGRVIMHTFLGPVTRIGLDSDVGPLIADLPSGRALVLCPGTAVALRVDPGGLGLLPRGEPA